MFFTDLNADACDHRKCENGKLGQTTLVACVAQGPLSYKTHQVSLYPAH
jgi:hypothetical protein